MKTTSKFRFTLLCISILILNSIAAQDTAIFRKINTDVYEQFENAFKTGDAVLLNSLHSKDVLRIPAEQKTIIPGQEYFDSQVKSFEWTKENGYKTEISLRFIERIAYKDFASDRGIFKFVVTEPDNIVRVFYGKFHVLLKNQDGTWKICMDYDSTENGTIAEKDYLTAFDKWNFQPFLPVDEE